MSSIRPAIEAAKTRLPLPELLRVLGFSPPPKGQGNMRSPFAATRRQKSPSFSIFRRGDSWRWCDRTAGQEITGDEITLLERLENLSRKAAISRYLALAGQQDTKPKRYETETVSSGVKAFSWSRLVERFTDRHAKWMSDWRGYSYEFVKWLSEENLIGIYKDNLALPVHNNHGEVIEAHVRMKTGSWFYFPRGAGCRPLIIGDTRNTKSTMVFESQWDAFAVMDQCGWHREEPNDWAVLITRGASNGRFAACATGDVYAWPQNDIEKEGKRAGEEWLRDVARHASGKVFRVAVPEQFKDANDWARGER